MNRLCKFINRQEGIAMMGVLAMLVFSSLVIVPSINYMATNLNAGSMAKKEFKGTLSAEAGIEDALWKLSHDAPASYPYQYYINDINGMTVEVTIDEIDTLSGEEIGDAGHHEEWLIIEKIITYDSGVYSFDMSVSNNGSGNFKVVKILIDFPPNVEYVSSSTSSNITRPLDAEPNVIGSSTSGITLIWNNSTPLPQVVVGGTEYHHFELSGPPGIEDIEGHGFIEVNREDIGTVWDSDSIPYSIIARATDGSGKLIATIRAGVWTGAGLDISCWQFIK